MDRRRFIGTGVAGVAGATTASLAAPAVSKGNMQWRMVTTWPKNLPGLGAAAQMLADLIGEATEGRLTIEVFSAGELVPAFEAIDAVAAGTVEMGHGSSAYWKKQAPAAQFLAGVPFGMTAQEQNAWLYGGGGNALADEIYESMGCKFFPSGNPGVQMGGWFNTEINTMDDYNDLKMRITGLGGEVVKAAGGNAVTVPGNEILSALEDRRASAVEWIGPYDDLAFGFYKYTKYYYYPGWHAPGTVFDNFINMRAWEQLPGDIRAIIKAANATVNHFMLSDLVANNNAALKTLRQEHGVILKQFPDDVLMGLARIARVVINDLASQEAMSRRIMDSVLDFRSDAVPWTSLSETSYTAARFLYSYG